jgi:hypothetical protein
MNIEQAQTPIRARIGKARARLEVTSEPLRIPTQRGFASAVISTTEYSERPRFRSPERAQSETPPSKFGSKPPLKSRCRSFE